MELEEPRRADEADQPAAVGAEQVRVPGADRPEPAGRQAQRTGVEEVAAARHVGRRLGEGGRDRGVLVGALEVAPRAGGDQPASRRPGRGGSRGRRTRPVGRVAGRTGRRGARAASRPGRPPTRRCARRRRSPGPAWVAVTSRREPSRTGVPSASVTRRTSRRPSCPNAPASTGPLAAGLDVQRGGEGLRARVEPVDQVVAGAGHPAARLLRERGELRAGEGEAEGLGRHREPAEPAAAVPGGPAARGDPQADRVVVQLDGQAGIAAGQRDLAGADRRRGGVRRGLRQRPAPRPVLADGHEARGDERDGPPARDDLEPAGHGPQSGSSVDHAGHDPRRPPDRRLRADPRPPTVCSTASTRSLTRPDPTPTPSAGWSGTSWRAGRPAGTEQVWTQGFVDVRAAVRRDRDRLRPDSADVGAFSASPSCSPTTPTRSPRRPSAT